MQHNKTVYPHVLTVLFKRSLRTVQIYVLIHKIPPPDSLCEFLGRQKEQGRPYRDNPGGDRGRDNRDLNRRQGRDTQKMQEKSEDTNKE